MVFTGDEEMVEELMQRVRQHVFPKRVRCKEYFSDFDRLNAGRCTVPQFHRAISQMGTSLLEDDMNLLAEHFTEHGPKVQQPQVVNYVNFCHMIDDIFHSNDAQENLKSTSMTLSPSTTVMSTFLPNSVEDEDKFMNLLHRIAAVSKARGVQLKPSFQDLDRACRATPSRTAPRRSGKVTRDQFKRHWPFKKEFSADEVDLLCEKYATPEGGVHYMALHNEVSEVPGDPAQPFPTSPFFRKPDAAQWSHASSPAVERIKAKVAEKRARLLEHFQDFDPLRKGFCATGQVKTVFTIMNIGKDVDKNDFEELLSIYTGDDGQFNYKQFCTDVDHAFTKPGLEKHPLAMLDMPDHTTTMAARRNTMALSPSKQGKINKVEDKIRSYVRKRNLEMKPLFLDFDRTRRGYVSRSQFQRILSTMSLELDEKSIGLLCNMYCDFGNHSDFNYSKFLKGVDPLADDVEVAMMQMTSPHVAWKPNRYFDTRGKLMAKSMSTPGI